MRLLLNLILMLSMVSIAHSSQAAISKDIVIQTLVLEAGGEGYEGMVAVAEVIRNRANKAHRTFEAVVLAPRQFSCWNAPGQAQERLKRVSWETFKIAQDAWKTSGMLNKTRRATHYHNLTVHPYWAVGHVPTVTIGRHRFYNDIQ